MLTAQELEILELEKLQWKYVGAKEGMIRERLGLSLTAYYQILNRLIDTAEASALHPMLTSQLRARRLTRLKPNPIRQIA